MVRPETEQVISGLMLELGIPAHLNSYQYVRGGYGADWERNETVVSGFGKALFDHGPKDRTGNPKCDRSFLGTWKRRIVQKAVRIQQQQRAQQADKQRIHRIGSGLCAPGTGICLTNKYYISHPLRHGEGVKCNE